MNVFDILILLLIGGTICLSLRGRKKKKSGCCGCCADCSDCIYGKKDGKRSD